MELRGSKVLVRDHGEMIMLSSYSYLGLLGHPRINKASQDAVSSFGTGTHGVRLLAGTTSVHVELERELARLKNTEAAVAFSSGYVTNVSAITAIAGRHDHIFCDRLNHASIVDGCTLSGATVHRFRHNDTSDLRRLLESVPAESNKLVIVDAVFSMDGDVINLPAVCSLCREFGALLMVDEAHSFGVLGETGTGIEEHFGLPPSTIDIKMGTLSKSIPSVGGYIAASEKIVDLIKHRGRSFIYSAALPPSSAAAALEALNVIKDERWRIESLATNTTRFISGLQRNGIDTLLSTTAIVPVVLGDNDRAHRCARACQQDGLFVQCIPSPVVPKGTERLRCIITAIHSEAEIDRCIATITSAVKSC